MGLLTSVPSSPAEMRLWTAASSAATSVLAASVGLVGVSQPQWFGPLSKRTLNSGGPDVPLALVS